MATIKRYPFSVRKHAHDIQLFRNWAYNTMYDMRDGEIPWDNNFADWYESNYDGKLSDLYELMFSSGDGNIVYLTGEQIGLAKEIVAWAYNKRADSLVKSGKTRYLCYL